MSEQTCARLGGSGVAMRWDVKVPLRDGTRLSATLYLPEPHDAPSPAIFILTPYVGQMFHEFAMYFAAHGYPFLTIDVRGRGNSEGVFRPLNNESRDGFDIVEWLARQPYCDGKVAMWGGSYSGYTQWAAAREAPPHLATIVPVASPCLGVDFPIRNNIASPYWMRWLTFVSGRTSQEQIFADDALWNGRCADWLRSGEAFRSLDARLGNPSATFQEWVAHPEQGPYWDAYNPTPAEYARMSQPVLTITGMYDGDQPGALAHYRRHVRYAHPEVRSRHFLVIGPWDHAGTRRPKAEFAGMRFGPQSCLDLRKLHLGWYDWTLRGGPRPEFLRRNVAWYVTGADRWRYADTLEEITAELRPLYVDSAGGASGVFASGALREQIGRGGSDAYVYDPRDLDIVEIELASAAPLSMRPTYPTDDLTDQRLALGADGRALFYHSAPFEADTELGGFFELRLWIAIDQPDTDIRASVYEITREGTSIFLTSDVMRARYRESLREPRLIRTTEPLEYVFERFTFCSRLVRRGSRLRLMVGPAHSIHSQKNYNSGGVVSEETLKDARPVTVRVFHGAPHPSALYVPLARPEG